MTTLQIKVQHVRRAVCRLGRYSDAEMIGPCRTRDLAHWRQRGMYVSRVITGQSYPQIGRLWGGRDHTTVLFATRKWFWNIVGSENERETIELVIRYATEFAEAEELARVIALGRYAQAQASETPEAPELMVAA